MTRWVVGALFFCVGLDLLACPLCMGGGVPTSAQMFDALGEVVLAAPTADESSFRVVAVIKGTEPPGSLIEARALQAHAAATTGGKPLLLARDDTWPTWMSLGTIGAKHASWLRQVAAGNRSTFMSPKEWRDRVVAMLPYLGHPEPLADEIAYGEVVAAPYSALLAAKSRLSARAASARHALEVPGVRREGVLLTADAGDHLREFSGRVFRRALEHQVLEKMRKTRFARRLVGCTDLVPDHVRDDGRSMVGDHDQLQSIAQYEIRNLRTIGGGLRTTRDRQ